MLAVDAGRRCARWWSMLTKCRGRTRKVICRRGWRDVRPHSGYSSPDSSCCEFLGQIPRFLRPPCDRWSHGSEQGLQRMMVRHLDTLAGGDACAAGLSRPSPDLHGTVRALRVSSLQVGRRYSTGCRLHRVLLPRGEKAYPVYSASIIVKREAERRRGARSTRTAVQGMLRIGVDSTEARLFQGGEP